MGKMQVLWNIATKKTSQFPNKFTSDCRVRVLGVLRQTCIAFQNKRTIKTNNHLRSTRNIESKALYLISIQLIAEMDAKKYFNKEHWSKLSSGFVHLYIHVSSHPLFTIITNSNLLELMLLIYILSSS